MSVSLITTGESVEIPPHIAAAITEFTASGPGSLFNVSINGITFRKCIQFAKSAHLSNEQGLIIDGKVMRRLKDGDDWYVGEIVSNRVIYKYNYKEAMNGGSTIY